MASRGELHISHFDRAVFDELGAEFYPFPNPDQHELLEKQMRQMRVEGVNGAGDDDRVVVVWGFPSDVFNRYVLPGINVDRTGWDEDGERKTPPKVGRKYKVPSDNAERVKRVNPATGEVFKGYDEYVQRLNPDPYELVYDIEVRARYQSQANALQRAVRRSIRDRTEIEVEDTEGAESRFTVFRDGGPKDAGDYVDTLHRYHAYVLSYRVEAELDEWPETKVTAATEPPVIRGGTLED